MAPVHLDEDTLDNTDRPGSPLEDIIQLERDDPRAVDFRDSLRTWFGKCAWSAISLHSIRTWLYWTIFADDLPALVDLPPVRRIFLDQVVEALEKRVGCKIPDVSGGVTPFRLTLDTVNVIPRPLWWYAVIALINGTIRKWFEVFHDVRLQEQNGLEYVSIILQPFSG